MAVTEAVKYRPSWAEISSQGAAFALNIVNLTSPAPITDITAATMALSAGAFTGLEVANLTTPDKSKKVAAVLEGLGTVLANRGLAMLTVGVATSEEKLWIPGYIAFQAGTILFAIGHVVKP